MATYPKVLKPWRGFPNANVIHCISAHVQMVTPDPSLGQFALTLDVARHVGTIPRGAIILPAFSSIKTAFAPAATIDLGSQAVPGSIMPSASIAPGTIANVGAILGAGSGGPLAVDTAVYILMGGAQATAGAGSFVIPFYIHKD